jgi:A/G-specific adenine glycosylase
VPDTTLASTVSHWYAGAARDLPWRRPGVDPWAVLVSEVMLQQTQVARVLPAYAAWLDRWPTPAALAADPPGEAVRMWGRLGYPRRALRLHACAVTVVERFDGRLPATVPELLQLPGVGDYTARAVVAFAHRRRVPVVDTNVRRVVARTVQGRADAPVTRADLALVEALLPDDDEAAATASVALMELGALVCTARAPRCPSCPVRASCAWVAAGRPDLERPCAGRRASPAATGRCAAGCSPCCATPAARRGRRAGAGWDEPVQRARALDGLVADGPRRPPPRRPVRPARGTSAAPDAGHAGRATGASASGDACEPDDGVRPRTPTGRHLRGGAAPSGRAVA